MITEIVKFKTPETATDEEITLQCNILNDFQKNMDGYIDAELIKDVQDNSCCLVYHYENMQKLKAIGEKMRSSKVFDDFNSVVVPGSLSISFSQQIKKWN